MSKAKQIGTKAETMVVEYFKSLGFEDVKRVVLHGKSDLGDIHINCDKKGIPNIIIEVKSRNKICSRVEIKKFYEELRQEVINVKQDFLSEFAFLIVKVPREGKS